MFTASARPYEESLRQVEMICARERDMAGTARQYYVLSLRSATEVFTAYDHNAVIGERAMIHTATGHAQSMK